MRNIHLEFEDTELYDKCKAELSRREGKNIRHFCITSLSKVMSIYLNEERWNEFVKKLDGE